jgi:hypothetical protein
MYPPSGRVEKGEYIWKYLKPATGGRDYGGSSASPVLRFLLLLIGRKKLISAQSGVGHKFTGLGIWNWNRFYGSMAGLPGPHWVRAGGEVATLGTARKPGEEKIVTPLNSSAVSTL